MRSFSHVMLISSPLQAVVAAMLLAGECELNPSRTIVFIEDDGLAGLFDDVACVAIANTRLAGRANISANLRLIESYLAGPVTLWVSDILWPMNNALYTALRATRRLEAVNFYDEGMVLYWQERLSRLSSIRQCLKFVLLRLRLGTRFTCPARAPFYDNDRNGHVYALHPELLSSTERVRPVVLDLDRVESMGQRLDAQLGNSEWTRPLVGGALVLSQPYYRVADPEKFLSVMHGLATELRRRGHDRLFIKLHPSEGIAQFDKNYRRLGFDAILSGLKAPVETVLRSLPASCTLASFNSSALLNARKYGFKGNILSYGLDWVADQYPWDHTLFNLNKTMLEQVDVEMVLHRVVESEP